MWLLCGCTVKVRGRLARAVVSGGERAARTVQLAIGGRVSGANAMCAANLSLNHMCTFYGS